MTFSFTDLVYFRDDDFPMPQSSDEIDKESIKEEIQYLEKSLGMPSKNFETIQNIEQCNTKWIQNELIKTITDPPDSLIVNDKITISDYTIDNNNDGSAINV